MDFKKISDETIRNREIIEAERKQANEAKTSDEIEDCPVCWAKLDEGVCVNTQCLINNGVSEL